MRRHRYFILISLLALAAPASAETCPVKHPALTALDHASMLAAYTASFRGIFNRNPTLAPGSGADDGTYWVAVSDHFGEFGDTVCRAGWSAYWEVKLTGQDAVNPALGDQPARFQPETTPPSVVPAPTPNASTPPPSLPGGPLPDRDCTTAVLAAIADLKQTVSAEHAEQTRSITAALKNVGEFALKYLAPEIGAWIVGHQMAK